VQKKNYQVKKILLGWQEQKTIDGQFIKRKKDMREINLEVQCFSLYFSFDK
jgi:hypothetical protein